MASTDATAVPVKNQAYRLTFPILDADGDLVTAAGSLDSEVSKDAGTFADCTNEATEVATSSGMYYLDLTSTEMNADTVAVIVKSSSGKTTPIVLYPQESGDIKVELQSIGSLTLTGAYPALGIIDSGTAQSAAALTFTLRSAAALADNSLTGNCILITNGTSIGEMATIVSNVGSTDVCTLAGSSTGWSGGVTPSGTPTYIVFSRPPDAGIATALLTIAKLEAAFASSGVFSAGALVNTPSAGYIRSSTVTTTGTSSTFTDSTIPETGTNKLRGATLYWTGGANSGAHSRIETSVGTSITLAEALPAAITSGDAYRLYHDAMDIADGSLAAIAVLDAAVTALQADVDTLLTDVATVGTGVDALEVGVNVTHVIGEELRLDGSFTQEIGGQ